MSSAFLSPRQMRRNNRARETNGPDNGNVVAHISLEFNLSCYNYAKLLYGWKDEGQRVAEMAKSLGYMGLRVISVACREKWRTNLGS